MPLRVVLIGILLGLTPSATRVIGAEWRTPSTHPRLFLHVEDIAAMRVRCGTAHTGQPSASQSSSFSSLHDETERLKAVAAEIIQEPARPDDLFVPAILHLIAGDLAQPDAYTKYIAGELTVSSGERIGLDGLVALDWCWDALDASARSKILDRLSIGPNVLDATQSPLDHRVFGRSLEALAAAIVVDRVEAQDHGSLAGRLQIVRDQATKYFAEPFPRFCRQRGVMPTSPASGVWEEADIALACELWRSASGENLLELLSDSAGRILEHYFYADTEHAALEHGFIHDDGSTIPRRPGQTYRGFVPAVPFVLARYAADPVAAWYAARSLPLLPERVLEADRYLWVRLLYGPVETHEAPRKAMPLGRSFGGGWVAMRSGWAPGETVLLFDAGQPFWRSRQHFDAGQFQIYRKGRLAIDSGDDVAFQAVLDQGGRTLIGGESGDWDQFARATIAHNCVTVADAKLNQRLYDSPWPAMGNQRLIERDYTPDQGDVRKTPRWTGSLTAFETNSFFSYAAADLTPAYPTQVVRSISRQILFVHSGAVVILDRLDAIKPGSLKTWHLQLPTRPTLLNREPSAPQHAEFSARQIHGVNQEAGIWELDPNQSWLSVTNAEGRLFVQTLLPKTARRRPIGGPMEPRTIKAGSRAGATYFGDGPLGYQYHLWPASLLQGPNASYELGSPVGLGPQFGDGAAWGRYEVYPGAQDNTTIFLHVLIPTDATVSAPPVVRFESDEREARIEIGSPQASRRGELPDQAAHIALSLTELKGQVSIRNGASGEVVFEKDLAVSVEP